MASPFIPFVIDAETARQRLTETRRLVVEGLAAYRREKAQAGGATANGHSATSNGGENPTADDQGKNQSNHATRSGNKDDEDKDHSARRARTLEEYRPLFRALGVPPECMEQFADVGSLPQSGEEKLYVMQLMLLRFFSSWSE